MLKRENLNFAYSFLFVCYRKACLIKDSRCYKNYGTEFIRFKIVIPKVLQTKTNKNKIL